MKEKDLFTEITEKALKNSLQNIQDLNMNMFLAQQARRIIDRLIGYQITPLLGKIYKIL